MYVKTASRFPFVLVSMHIVFFFYNLWLPGVGAGDTQADGVINQTNEHRVTGLGLNPIETKPNQWQTFVALLRLRVLRMFRDIQKLYFTVLLPLGLAACGLYVHSIQSTVPKMKSLVLNGGDYMLFMCVR